MISSSEKKTEIQKCFNFLNVAPLDFQEAFFNHASTVSIPAGYIIASDGDQCAQLALVYSGTVRVYKLAETGREITLYRIEEGNSCILTASCIISDRFFPAMAQTESQVEAIIISASKAQAWITEYSAWSQFIFGLISERLVDVISLLENAVFHRMDERIAAYLIAKPRTELQLTHQQIAADLGTTREVVSRILKGFENEKLIDARRGALIINNFDGLRDKIR